MQSVEQLARLLIYVGGVVTGVASTVAGSWISSKIQVYHGNRKAHLEDIKQRVLLPVRHGLEHFEPLVAHRKPIVLLKHGSIESHEAAPLTEYPTQEGPMLVAAYPGADVFGLAEPALLQDAQKNHFPILSTQLDTFVSDWATHAGECHKWVAKMAREILQKSHLPAFPNRGPENKTYVMHYRLAVFVYERLFQISNSAIQKEQIEFYPGVSTDWCLKEGSYTLASGPKHLVDTLVIDLDKLRESESKTAQKLRAEAGKLREDFRKLSQALDLAIVSLRLRRRCDLVTFF